jgi:acyl dehydratase
MSSLQPGAELDPLIIESVEVEPMKTMAMLLRDPNPIHWDVEVVRELGLGERPINQGPINVGYLMELAVRASGGRENVRAFRVRFTGNVLAGDRVVCSGRVISRDAQTGLVELELEATVDERAVLTGSATVLAGDD